jgi:hypothetical protein
MDKQNNSVTDFVKSPLFKFATIIVIVFLAGFGAYEGILKVARLDTVREENYISKDELVEKYVPMAKYNDLMQKYNLLNSEYERLKSISKKQSSTGNVKPIFTVNEKNKLILDIQELLKQANNFIENQQIEFDITSWQYDCLQLLKRIDLKLTTTYYSDFIRTKHNLTKADTQLYYRSVKEGISVLNNAKSRIKQ